VAVTKGPSLDPRVKRLAVEVEDHPLDYGDFEGTIPKGEYGGGTVQLWDRGVWAPLPGVVASAALKSGQLKFLLAGERLKGEWVLVRLKRDRDTRQRANWLLIKHRDRYARDDGDRLLKSDRSVASGRRMAQIAAGKGARPTPFMTKRATRASNRPKIGARARGAGERRSDRKSAPPKFVAPQLARLVERAPSQPGWGHEIKFDGYRMQMRVADGETTIRTRKGSTGRTSSPRSRVTAAGCRTAWSTERSSRSTGAGVPSFSSLQAALMEEKTAELIFFPVRSVARGRDGLARAAARGAQGAPREASQCGWRGGAVALRRALRDRGRRNRAVGLPHGARGHRVEAAGRAVPVGPRRCLAEDQVSRRA
jgi:bifunctional non-homologous end joining protein LigD